VLDVRRAAAKLLFVVVVMAWRAMPPWPLKLMTGLGRAVLRGCRPHPGGTPGPVRITGREWRRRRRRREEERGVERRVDRTATNVRDF